ncbi:hypothetical protein BH20ACI3_BH20ACI3_27440 [soil metagenome]
MKVERVTRGRDAEIKRRGKRPRIGFHAPISGGLHNALIRSNELDCQTVQIFSRNPRGWKAKPLDDEEVELFKRVRRKTKISPVAIHANYLINLAAADEGMLQKSRASFREELERGILLRADYLVVHPGSARGACEADGIQTCAESLKRSADGLDLGSIRILLENTAGQGECIGHRFEHLRESFWPVPTFPSVSASIRLMRSPPATTSAPQRDSTQPSRHLITRWGLRKCWQSISTIQVLITIRGWIATGTSDRVTSGRTR